MNCSLCRNGTTKAGHVTVTLERGGTTVVLRDVPAEVCENCGEYYLSKDVTERVLAQGEKAVAAGAEVEIIRYAA
jgi:YgiT-type zinc finger domain-containing protein